MQTTAPKIMTAEEAAEFIGVSLSTIYKEARKGLMGQKVGAKWIFLEDRLVAYLSGESYYTGGEKHANIYKRV